MDLTRILTLEEVLLCLKDLKRRIRKPRKGRNNYGVHTTLIIFRLAVCCGLRRSEISSLTIGDLILEGRRPCITIRKINTKGRIDQKKSRHIPLWWDAGTLEDLRVWRQIRIDEGAGTNDYVVLGLKQLRVDPNAQMDHSRIARRFKNAIKVLGPERRSQVSVHGGRHTFATLSLHAGHSLVEVQEALGHRSINSTTIYLHAVPRNVPDVFSAERLDEEAVIH